MTIHTEFAEAPDAPSGAWTATHQMTVNGTRDGFTMADIRAAGKAAGLTPRQVAGAADDVRAAANTAASEYIDYTKALIAAGQIDLLAQVIGVTA